MCEGATKVCLGCWPEGQKHHEVVFELQGPPRVVVRLHPAYSLLVVRGRVLRKREGPGGAGLVPEEPGRCKWQERRRGK